MKRLILYAFLALFGASHISAQGFEFKPLTTFSDRILQAHPYNNQLYLVMSGDNGYYLMRVDTTGNDSTVLIDSLGGNWSPFKGRSWNRGNSVRFFEYQSQLYIIAADRSNTKGLSIYLMKQNGIRHRVSFEYSNHDRLEFSTDSSTLFLRTAGEYFYEDRLESVDLKTWSKRDLSRFGRGFYGIYNDSLLYGSTDLNFKDGRTGKEGSIIKFQNSPDTTKPDGIWPSGWFWFKKRFYFSAINNSTYNRNVFRDSADQFVPYIRKKDLPWGAYIGSTDEAAVMITSSPLAAPLAPQLVRLKDNGDIRAHSIESQRIGYENFGPTDVIFGRDSLFHYYNGKLDSVYTLPDLHYAKEIIWHNDRFFIMTFNHAASTAGQVYTLTPGSRTPQLIVDGMTHDLADTIFSKNRTTHMFTYKNLLFRFDSTTLFLWTDQAVGDKQIESGGIKGNIFPNPASDIVNIRVGEGIYCELRVTDISGRKIWFGTFNDRQYQLNTGNWNKGVYLVTVEQNNRSQTFKLTKE